MLEQPATDTTKGTAMTETAASTEAPAPVRPRATRAKVKASEAAPPRQQSSQRAAITPEPAEEPATPAGEPATATPAGERARAAVPVLREAPSADPSAPFGALTIHQGGLEHATARTIDVHQGGIARANATDIAVSQGGIAIARGDRVSVELGGAALTFARESRITQSFASSVLANEVTIDQGLVQTLIARRVTVNRPTGVLVMIAGRVEGDIRPILDWRGALAAGAVIGLLLGILRRR